MTFAGDKEIVIAYAENGIASVTSSILRYSNKIKKLAKTHLEETKLWENEDGSVYMQFPAEWIKLPSPKKQVTEKNRLKAIERMKKAREQKKE
mgnify:CR=1 FL=1